MAKSHVLLIYTGGTIGMVNDPHTGSLVAFDFGDVYKHVPELARLNVDLSSNNDLTPVDSSEMNPEMWAGIAKIVKSNYEMYDGFVILHGSDTMAFTASALSFMLQGLEKPVILTGSQLPIGTIRTDGKENLITAIEIAAAKDKNGKSRINEVAIYFEYSLYRGNRTSKISASSFEAFRSPNFPPLAVAGVHINYREIKEQKKEPLKLAVEFEPAIGLIKIFPGLPWKSYESIFDVTKTKGIVLETFGSGNASSDPDFQKMLSNYITQGGTVLNITQCSTGFVEQGKYETSSFFEKIGVISGKDMTTEAAVTKLMFVLGSYGGEREKVSDALSRSVSGELTN